MELHRNHFQNKDCINAGIHLHKACLLKVAYCKVNLHQYIHIFSDDPSSNKA